MAKTTIRISGGINGNFKLCSAIITHEATEHKFFNDIVLRFPTKKSAYKALWDGYKYMRKSDSQDPFLRYSAKSSLSYDASRAVIEL